MPYVVESVISCVVDHETHEIDMWWSQAVDRGRFTISGWLTNCDPAVMKMFQDLADRISEG